jgi:helix-turn-helix protein
LQHPYQTLDRTIEPIAVTIPDAIRISGLSRSEIYRRLAAGDLEAIKSGARTLILLNSIKRYLASLPTAQYRGPKDA